MKDGKISSLGVPILSSATKQEVLDYFDNSWLITEIIFSGTSPLTNV
jgi:L-lysine 2,3-aminomutase